MLHMGQGVVEWEAGTGVDCHDTFPAERCISTQTTFVWYRRSELKIPCKFHNSSSPFLSPLSLHTRVKPIWGWPSMTESFVAVESIYPVPCVL